MFKEARKIHIIEEMLKVNSDEVLSKLESVLNLTNKKTSAHNFIGAISKKDMATIAHSIEEGCEQVNADDWK